MVRSMSNLLSHVHNPPTQSEAVRGDPIQKLHFKLPLYEEVGAAMLIKEFTGIYS